MIKEEVINNLKKIKFTHLIKSKYSLEIAPGKKYKQLGDQLARYEGKFQIQSSMLDDGVQNRKKKSLGEFHLYFRSSKQLSLCTEYKLYPLPIPLEKLDDVKKIYALVILLPHMKNGLQNAHVYFFGSLLLQVLTSALQIISTSYVRIVLVLEIKMFKIPFPTCCLLILCFKGLSYSKYLKSYGLL